MKNYNFSGTVIRGVDLGARFGIATANIDTNFSEIQIEEGVYFVTVSFRNSFENPQSEKSYLSSLTSHLSPAIMHYGPRKTFGGEKSIEIHLLDFSGDLYGQVLDVQVLKFYRPVKKFPNADVLFTQIEHDIIQAQKYFLRQTCKKKWADLTDEEKHLLVQKTRQKVSQFQPFLEAKNVLVFIPMDDEIPYTQDLYYGFSAKKYYFPRVEVDTKKMQFFASDWDELIPGAYTLEPKISADIFDIKTTEKTLVFVPALAVSSDGQRLGRGAGFYDRFLADCVENENITTVSVQPSFAVSEEIPVEVHDQVLDEVLIV